MEDLMLIGILGLFAGIAIAALSFRLCFVRLSVERARNQRMLASSGLIVTTPASLNDGITMVSFQTRDGKQVVAPVGMTDDSTMLHVREQVSLRYDPEDPQIVALDGQPPRTQFLLVGGCILLIGGLVLVIVSAAFVLKSIATP
jgi:hypothetical protein